MTETRSATGPKAAPGETLVRTEGLRKAFPSGDSELIALADVNAEIKRGEMVAVTGPSGAGKSTLLHLLAALDRPTSGTVYFDGNSLESLSEAELVEFRRRSVGFIWQRHHLLPDFTAEENVAMPLLLQGMPRGKAAEAAGKWLDEVGLTGRKEHRAGELSGGEQQRVAIARALVNQPALVLADEPTGDLDEGNSELVFQLLQSLHRSYQLTSILATHNQALARRADRILVLEHGSIRAAEDVPGGSAATAAKSPGGGANAMHKSG
ncbi:MAG: ABC transporter ATP-binding protein [Candidatus Acidiferrales bacterium]